MFEGETSGFGAGPTPGSTTNPSLGEICCPLGVQAELKYSDQDLGFGIPVPSNHWNSSCNLESQPWGVSTGQNHTNVPSHATIPPVTFTNNFIAISFDTNNYAQSINCSAPDSYLDLQASNVPASGPHSLDFFSMDFGQAPFEMLMPAPDNSREFVLGSSLTFSDPTFYQDLLQNNNVASLPNGNTFDVAGFQHAQVLQGQNQASQDDTHALPGPTTILNQPNPVQQLDARSSTYACANGNCNKVSKRKSDLDRHRKTVHGMNHIKFFFQVSGCPKGRGLGERYNRDDKLTEHLWKKLAIWGTRRVDRAILPTGKAAVAGHGTWRDVGRAILAYFIETYFSLAKSGLERIPFSYSNPSSSSNGNFAIYPTSQPLPLGSNNFYISRTGFIDTASSLINDLLPCLVKCFGKLPGISQNVKDEF